MEVTLDPHFLWDIIITLIIVPWFFGTFTPIRTEKT